MTDGYTDLFGEPITSHKPWRGLTPSSRKKKTGYAASPGTGPPDEICKTCEHYCRVHYHDKVWRKCGLLKDKWTHGPGTDIKASSPACEMWEEVKDD